MGAGMSDPSNELQALRDEVASLRSRVERPRRIAAWLFLPVVVLTSTLASGQLVTFVQDTPARAAEVNANFTQLQTWLEQKVGAVGNSTVTTPSVVLSGATPVTLAGGPSGLTLSGGLALADNTGITSNRFGATASVASSPTTTFGAGFLEGTFTDAGGTIVILASASAYCSSAGRIIMNVKVDGATIGAMRVTCNTTLAHMAFPSAHLRLNRLLLPNATFNPPVTRTVRLEPINCTSGCAAGIVTTLADVNDFGEVTVLRLPTP